MARVRERAVQFILAKNLEGEGEGEGVRGCEGAALLWHVPAVGVAAEQGQVAGHTTSGVLGHQNEGRAGAEEHERNTFASHVSSWLKLDSTPLVSLSATASSVTDTGEDKPGRLPKLAVTPCSIRLLLSTLECQYARYSLAQHDTVTRLALIRPCAAAPTAGPARGSTGMPASAASTGRTRTGGRTARRGASSGWRSTRCTWSRLRWSTQERRGGR